MKLKCLQCEHEFEGFISKDDLGWHGMCPSCGGSFDVDLPEGEYILAFTSCADGDDPYANYKNDIQDAAICSYYAFSNRKDFLEMWEKKVYDEEPDGPWYWAIHGDNCICCGGPNPEDIEILCDAWDVGSDCGYDIAFLLQGAYESCGVVAENVDGEEEPDSDREPNEALTEEEISQFKSLFSKFCRGEVNAGRCGDGDCSNCTVNHAYDEIFDSLEC